MEASAKEGTMSEKIAFYACAASSVLSLSVVGWLVAALARVVL